MALLFQDFNESIRQLEAQFKEKKMALESKAKAAFADAKDFYRSEMLHLLGQSKLFSHKKLQDLHTKVQQSAVDKLKGDLTKLPPEVLKSKEKQFTNVGPWFRNHPICREIRQSLSTLF
jgi:multidrug resistance efflux pump